MEMDDDDMVSSVLSTDGQSQAATSEVLAEGNEKQETSSAITSFTAAATSSASSSSCNLSRTGNDDDSDHCDDWKTGKLLLEDYRKILQAPDSIMEPNIDAAIKGFLRLGGQPEVVITSLSDNYCGFAQYCELLSGWLSDLQGDQKIVHECFEKTLSSLIEKRFVAKVVDENLEAAKDVDEWLPELLQRRIWRNLIYTLIEQNSRSKFLMKAIRIISEAGFQHEITNVHPAAQQLEIYCRMVLTAIDDFFMKQKKGPMTEEYEKGFAELIRVVCYSEHTYLFAQILLHEIIKEERNETAAACTYLAQILRREAQQRHYQDTHDIHLSIDGGNNGVRQSIYTMLSKKCLNQADVIRLYEHYSSAAPPPVEFIQDPFFIDMLIDMLFAYEGSRVHPNHRSKYIFLLSYASCRTSDDANNQRENEEIEKTRAVMEHILDNIRSEGEFLKDIPLLLYGIEFPSVASGLLQYLKGFLLSDKILCKLEMVHFVLLDEIATKHCGLHIRLFKILCELYDRQSKLLQPAEMIIAKQRSTIDRLVHLLSVGFALPVIEKINKMFHEGQIDISLVRYFAVDVLDIIEPPYSEEFIETFLPMVLNQEIFDKLTMTKVPAAKRFIQDAMSKTAEGDTEEGIVEYDAPPSTSEVLSELIILKICSVTS
uniref:Negative elongation factor D n=1 Tax=Elaeophora elaphi TaxID=1147741 RepID=A0A0R3RTH4_9BILA